MRKPSTGKSPRNELRKKIIGLGEHSIQKSYYPQLRQQLQDVEAHKRSLEEQAQALAEAVATLEQAKKQAEENEQTFRTLFENVGDGILLVDVQTKQIALGNPMMCAMLGCSPAELMQFTLRDIHPTAQYAEILTQFESQVTQHLRLIHDVPVQRQDGSVFYADVNATPVTLNQTTYLMRIFRDMSTRKAMETALRKSEERLQLALELAHDGLFEWNFLTNEMYFSPRYYTMLGFTPYELPQTPETWTSLLHPSDRDFAVATLNEYLTHGRIAHEIEFRLAVKTGGWRWILSRGGLMETDADGCPVRMVGTHVDITDRKQIESEILRLNAELEQRVTQRTRELEQSNRDLDAFAYIVSHDLKAPLRGINQIASWLREDYAHLFDAAGQELFGLLMGRVKWLDRLIDGILQYSRIGRWHDLIEPVNLNLLIQDVIDSLTPPARIRVEVTPDFPIIHADKTRIIQVFQHLIGNAVKFNDKPAGLIQLGWRTEPTQWVFSVADNGPGIAAQFQEKIFAIFQTAGLHQREESTGIGLAIVKKIIERYGGRIWVESTLGSGSRFFLTFPRPAVEM